MRMLEEKLATLRDGTEAVACVLANWDNVLRAITMASSECTCQTTQNILLSSKLWLTCEIIIVKVPRPARSNEEDVQQQQERQDNAYEPQLPVTLVRIPAQSQDPRQRHVEAQGVTS